MALQAGVSTVKVLFLVGAGLTGTFLVNNGRLSDFITDLSSVIYKHLDSSDVAAKVSDKTSELATQLAKIRQELMQLTPKEVTVINGAGSNGSGASVSTLAVPAVFVGAAGYGYFRWRGWTLTDFMYVTKRHMTNAVSEVSKQFDQVSAVLTATRKHLSMRIEDVSKALEDNAEVQDVIKNQVLDIRSDVARCGGDVQFVQQLVEGLESKIGEVQQKQNITNKGILLLMNPRALDDEKNRILLLQYLETGREAAGSKLLEQMPKPMLPPATSSASSSSSLPAAASSPSSSMASSSPARSVSLGGLKELQQISEKLEGEAPPTFRLAFRTWLGSR